MSNYGSERLEKNIYKKVWAMNAPEEDWNCSDLANKKSLNIYSGM